MHIQQLRYFIAVAEQLNFTEAAKHLYVSQPALSQQIADLEKQLNAQLFTRDRHSVRLTTAGAIFLQDACEIVAKAEQAAQKVRLRDANAVTGSISIGFLAQAEKRILPDLIRSLRNNYPLIKIKLTPLGFGDLFHKLENGTVDIGFSVYFGSQQIPGLIFETLFTSGTSVIMRRDNPLAQKYSIQLSGLAQEPFIMISRGECSEGFRHMLALCRKEGFIPNIVNEEIDIDTLLVMIEAGQGVSLLSNYIDISSYPNLCFVPIEQEDAKTDLGVTWRKNNSNPSIPLLLEQLRVIVKTDNFNLSLAHPEVS